MKAILGYSMRFPRYGLDMGPRHPQIDPQIDLQIDPQDLLQTGPQMALRCPSDDLRYPYAQNKGIFKVLLTVGELKTVPSKDWIRPPTPSQE